MLNFLVESHRGAEVGGPVHDAPQLLREHRSIGHISISRSDEETIILSADPHRVLDPYAERVPDALLRSLLAEPAVPDPPRRVRRDWILIACIVTAVVLEGILRPDMTFRPAAIVLGVGLAVTLLWRRTHPLAMTVAAFGVVIALDAVARSVAGSPVELYSSACLLILPYALFRWGSGRHAAIGLAVLAAVLVNSMVTAWTGLGDAIGGAIALLFPAVLGVEVRHLSQRRVRDREEVKVRERELLARELHDTVAHHVSAIAIQAQAGRVVGADRPEAALDALHVIEVEASRTLAEMRSIVGTLRGSDDAELAPQPGIGDIARLARASNEGDALRVEVSIPDEIGEVSPTIGAAAYRIAQEAITNARRHARDATLVSVRIRMIDGDVRLDVDDDGRTDSATRPGAGFGLVGMTERAHLLGGELTAGPTNGRGWGVTARIPLSGPPR